MVTTVRPRASPQSTNPRQAYQEQFGRQPRHVPPDSFFDAIAEAISENADPGVVRTLALQEVQRSRVPAEDKIMLWIPAPHIARVYGTPEVIHAINREPQSQTWDLASASICDMNVVKNRGIRFTCTNRDRAIKLGGTVVTCMGQKLIVKPYSAYDRFYYVDLTQVPSGLEEDMIYDYFLAMGLQPIIAPTHVAGSLTSRDRTVWFPQQDVPDALVQAGFPLREIHFAGFDNPVYVQHKRRAFNKVVPPSILAKRAASAERERVAQVTAIATRPQRQPRNGSTVPTPPEARTPFPEGGIILERPEVSAPVRDWVKVTRHALCSKAVQPRPSTALAVSTAQDPESDGRIVFGFPVKPTSFELAFCDHDLEDQTAGDADCAAFADQEPVSCNPLELLEPVRELVATRSLLKPKTNSMKRSEYRRLAKKAARELPTLMEPDDRLAALTAQPSVYAAAVHTNPPAMAPVFEEHTLLRLYSGKSSKTNGVERSLSRRINHDYPDGDAPGTSAILADQLPDDSDRDTARAYARVDLFFRTHAPSVYYDPVKVQALCGDIPVSSLNYANFLIWTDETLAALCRSQLGQEYLKYLSLPNLEAMQAVLDDRPSDAVSMASALSEAEENDNKTTVDDEAMDSPGSPKATHL